MRKLTKKIHTNKRAGGEVNESGNLSQTINVKIKNLHI